MAPQFEAAADALQTENLPLGRVDCTKEEELCRRYEIVFYPTMFTFQGDKYFRYDGSREASSLIGSMKRYSQPLVTALHTAKDIADFKAKDNVTIIGLFDVEDKQSRQIFTTIAEMYRDLYLFGASQLEQIEGIKRPALVLHKNFDEGQSVFMDEFSVEKIEDFLEDMAVPLIREFRMDTEAGVSLFVET